MTTDLLVLVLSVLLTQCLTIPVLIARQKTPGGIEWAFGNRETPLAGLPEWGARAGRAHENMLENLPLFAIAVLVVHGVGRANDVSAAGSIVFLVGRVVHALSYWSGVRYVRTAAYFAGTVGTLMVLSALLR